MRQSVKGGAVILALLLDQAPGRCAEGPEIPPASGQEETKAVPVFGYTTTLGSMGGFAVFHYPGQAGKEEWSIMAVATSHGKLSLDASWRQPINDGWYLRLHPSISSFPLPYFGEGIGTRVQDRKDLKNRESRSDAGFGFRFGGGADLSLNAFYRSRQGDALAGAPLPESCHAWGLAGALEVDHRDQPVNSREGWFCRALLINAPGDAQRPSAVQQLTTDLRAFQSLAVFTLAGRAIWNRTLSGTPGYLLRFSAGGDSVLRGYSLDRFRGDNLASGQVEVRAQFWKRVSLAAFVDTAALADGSFGRFRTSRGAGLRIGLGQTGKLKLRIDFGKGTDESNTTVAFGECF